MNLSYKEIKNLKGKFLVDIVHKNDIVKVMSATKNKITISNGSIILTTIFFDTHQKNYELATDEQITEVMEERYYKFLKENYDTIDTLANSPKYGWWGGNGRSMAESDLLKEKQYDRGYKLIDFDYIDANKILEEFLSDKF